MRALLGVALLILAGGQAAAQMVCGSRAALLAQLAGKWEEVPVAMGLKDDGSMLEITASIDGETWTAIVTQPNGVSCLVSTGERWESIPRVMLGPDL